MRAVLRRPAVRLTLIGCLCFFCFLCARLPAQWLVTLLPAACTFRCALVNVEGTVWEGQGEWIGIDDAGLAHPFTTLRWQWRPPHLKNQVFAWSIDNTAGGKIDVTFGGDGLRLSVHSFGLPAEVLPAILPAPLPRRGWGGILELAGEVSCQIGILECAGQASGNWRHARISTLFPSVLGDYRLALHGTFSGKSESVTTRINGDISSDRGPLWATGIGSLAGRRWQLTGNLRADGENQSRLESILSAFATQNPSTGSFAIQLQSVPHP